jgi:hypothetical protein
MFATSVVYQLLLRPIRCSLEALLDRRRANCFLVRACGRIARSAISEFNPADAIQVLEIVAHDSDRIRFIRELDGLMPR